jgi:hypothetical protein
MLLKEEIELNVLPFGLLELDADGTILYYRPDEKEDQKVNTAELVGHNILTDVMPLAQAAEFRERLRNFRRSYAPADSFHLTLRLEDGSVEAKVLLAHIREQTQTGATDSTLVHIRRV